MKVKAVSRLALFAGTGCDCTGIGASHKVYIGKFQKYMYSMHRILSRVLTDADICAYIYVQSLTALMIPEATGGKSAPAPKAT